MSRIKLKATVLTPLSIGDGGEYSPYKDYWIDKGKICFVDQLKLGKLLAKREDLMDEYVEGVAHMDIINKNRSAFILKNFAAKITKKREEDLVSHCVDFNGKTDSNLNIKTIARNPKGEAYVPGSSIKGAIKTALLYDWLKYNKDGKSWMDKFFELAGMEISLRSQETKLEEQLKILAGVDDKNQKYDRLLVTDSNAISREKIGVFDIERESGKEDNIRARLECLKLNTKFTFEIETNNYTWKQLAEKINFYSNANIYNELGEDISKKAGHIKRCETFLINMEADTNEAYEAGIDDAYIMLGFGKGVYYNSILLALKEDAEKDAKKKRILTKYLYELYYKRLKKEKLDLDLFPVTRFLKQNPALPLGWIKLEQVK